MFVIIRRSDNKYVARSGSHHSYTRKLEQAQTYPTRGAAEANKCENEYVREVRELFDDA